MNRREAIKAGIAGLVGASLPVAAAASVPATGGLALQFVARSGFFTANEICRLEAQLTATGLPRSAPACT